MLSPVGWDIWGANVPDFPTRCPEAWDITFSDPQGYRAGMAKDTKQAAVHRRLARIADELGAVQRDLAAGRPEKDPMLEEGDVARRLRVPRGRLRQIPSLVAIAVDLGTVGLRWEPEALERWLHEQQGRGAAA